MTRTRMLAAALGLALLAAACSSDPPNDDPTPDAQGGDQLVAQVASYDLAVGENRFIVGLLTQDNRLISGGTAELAFSFLGGDDPEPGPTASAEFLSLPGEEPGHEHPEAGTVEDGRGVYAAYGVAFDRPGPWQVEVTLDLDGEERSTDAAFQVFPEHQVPAVGDEALPTENHTLPPEGDVPLGAIDSRGEGGGRIPDRKLHTTTIAEAVASGTPAVIIFSTPVYCVSQFCGPITDMVDDLRADYEDRAAFIHVEVWRDFQGQVINEAAADWLLRNGNMQEPWVFFVDGEGVIQGRWDNVAARSEIEPFLEELPAL